MNNNRAKKKSHRVFLILMSALLVHYYFLVTASAQIPKKTPTPTIKTSPTPANVDRNVELLKEKIATKVAELRRESKKVLAGRITKVEKDYFMLETSDNKLYQVTVDETLTTIYSLIQKTATRISLTDLKLKDYTIVSGVPIENVINANIIYLTKQYIVTSGKVTDLNSKEFTIDVLTTQRDRIKLDVESSTTQFMYSEKSDATVRSGFSKIKVGDTIHFVIEKPDEQSEPLRAPALRLLLIPQETLNALAP